MPILNGKAYHLHHYFDEYTATMDPGGLIVTVKPPSFETLNKCEHCGRADYREIVARSWEEAIEFGWFVPTT